ncbi:hypothetical protein GDO81_026822 [Engystomops pustulosus]|uniref:Uncharacterized protein n=1 Tax=Engystomops pustulosus TaxID=76066 RepID=A0AAV6YJF4_ENGPU|nr:hypothetical protein GDO81_026822 [Engystomops pustulosus]
MRASLRETFGADAPALALPLRLAPPLPLPTCSRRGLASVSEALCSPGLSTQLGSVTLSSSDPSVCSPLGLPDNNFTTV